MTGRNSAFALFFWLTSAAVAGATSCGTNTLDTYIALGASGCTVGTFTFSRFSFGVVSSSGGATPVSASNVMVTPFASGGQLGLTYSSNGFTVSTGQRVQYAMSELVDDPPIIHGFALSMLDPPVFPGTTTITSNECLGANFSGSTCPDATASQTVFDNGVTSSLNAEQFFSSPVSVLGDQTTITLDASTGGSADVQSFSEAAVVVPEPAPGLAVVLGLMILFCRRGLFQLILKTR